jgi:hypothetical protein
MIDLSDTSFILITRLDSIERLGNMLLVTDYLTSSYEASIIVLEAAACNNGVLERLLKKNIRYTFQADNDHILFRTRYLNEMIRNVDTRFVAV